MSIPQNESPKPTTERLAFSIAEFCESVGISRSFFYSLSEGDKPRMVQRGRRWLIPADAARAWLAAPGVAS